MSNGGALGSVFLLWLLWVGTASADPAIDDLMACSDEYYARAEYMGALGQAQPAHLEFLLQRSDVFLRMAEARSPMEATCCPTGSGLLIKPIYCLGPACLGDERQNLMVDRLTELVEANKGVYRLPVCMEDEACSECSRLLGDLAQ